MMRIVALTVASVVVAIGGCNTRRTADVELQSYVASALLSEFETVVYETADLISGSGSYNQLPALDAKAFRFPFMYLRNALGSMHTRDDDELLANSIAVLVGAKDFQPPSGFGAVRSVRCYVAVLRNGTNFELREHFRESAAESVSTMQIWHWSAALDEFGENDRKFSSLFATQIGHSYVVVANDIKELRVIAELLAGPGQLDSSLLPSEWRSMSQKKMWGYRRYREVANFNRMAAGMHNVTSSAKALVFLLDSKEGSGVLRVLAPDPSTINEMNTEMISHANTTWQPFKPAGPGVWQTNIQFSGDAGSLEQSSFVIGLLGFAVYP